MSEPIRDVFSLELRKREVLPPTGHKAVFAQVDEQGRPIRTVTADGQVVGGGGGGGLEAYAGFVADSSMPTWTSSNVEWLSERLREQIYDDVDEVRFIWSINGSRNELPAGTGADIICTVDDPAGGRVPMTFGGETTGRIPAYGFLISDPVRVSQKWRRGGWIFYNALVRYLSLGGNIANGHHRNCRGILSPDSGERAVSVLTGGAQPPNLTSAGEPNNSSWFCLRPAGIIGTTRRHSVLGFGDSMSANDYTYPSIDGARRGFGLIMRGTNGLLACANTAQLLDSYFNQVLTNASGNQRFALRASLGQYASIILDAMGRNDSVGGITVANFVSAANVCRDRFPDKRYGKILFPPRTSSSDNWRTTTNQTVFNDLEWDYLREFELGKVADFRIDARSPFESVRGSGIWRASTQHVDNVTVVQSGNAFSGNSVQLQGSAGAFSRGLVGRLITTMAAGFSGTQTGMRVTSVSADGSTLTAVSNSGSAGTTTRAVILDPVTTDGIHPANLETDLPDSVYQPLRNLVA